MNHFLAVLLGSPLTYKATLGHDSSTSFPNFFMFAQFLADLSSPFTARKSSGQSPKGGPRAAQKLQIWPEPLPQVPPPMLSRKFSPPAKIGRFPWRAPGEPDRKPQSWRRSSGWSSDSELRGYLQTGKIPSLWTSFLDKSICFDFFKIKQSLKCLIMCLIKQRFIPN